jgi:hypothetical protein
VAHHYGTIAEVVVAVGCAGVTGGAGAVGCAIAAAGAFGTATYQNATSKHFSWGDEALDALGAVPGVQAFALEKTGVAAADALTPLRNLGTATGIGGSTAGLAIRR